MNCKGFTLAEVLITIGVIGIVASLTIPTLVNNNRNAQLRTGLNASYSLVSQAITRLSSDIGGNIHSRYAYQEDTLKPDLIKYFKVIKDCNLHDCVQPSGRMCYHYKEFVGDNNRLNGHYIAHGQFVLANGMTVFVFNGTGSHLAISVDVNGHNKGPNRLGYDFFTFQIMPDNTIRPAGSPQSDISEVSLCSTTTPALSNGIGCTAKALFDDSYWKELN